MRIFVNEEIEDVIRKYSNKTKNRKDFTWHYLYVVSNIYMRPFIDKRIEGGDYIPINKELLRKLISCVKADTIMDDLVNLNILECDGIFIIGEKSKGYRLKNKSSLKWQLVEMEDFELAKKLRGKSDVDKENVDESGVGYQIVNHWFHELEIDAKKAKKSMSNRYHRKVMNRSQYDSACCNIDMISNDMKFIVVDDTSNRLHCNLTNIDSKLRKFLTVNGEKLGQVDVSNSQPLFLGMAMIGNSMVDPVELDKYLDLVCKGEFYKFLAVKMPGEALDLEDDEVRKKFKKSIFSGVLFDENRSVLSKWEMLFQKEFPTIFSEVRAIKAENYNAMAIMLQKMESAFIFNTVEKIDCEIGKGKVPLLTIHDSIVTTWDYIDRVKQIMERLFLEEYGLKPSLKPTKFK